MMSHDKSTQHCQHPAWHDSRCTWLMISFTIMRSCRRVSAPSEVLSSRSFMFAVLRRVSALPAQLWL